MDIRGGQGQLNVNDDIFPQVITVITADVVLVLASPMMIILSTAEGIHAAVVSTRCLLGDMDFEIRLEILFCCFQSTCDGT